MTPIYRVLVDNRDITAKIRDRFISLRITDEVEDDSDSLELVIDDRDNLVEIPPTGRQIEVMLGYKGGPAGFGTNLVSMGLWLPDESEVSGPPEQLHIRARAANFSNNDSQEKNTLRQSRTQAWDGQTIGDIVETIAGRNGYTPRIADALASIAIAHIDQTDESDLHFLARLARRYDAIAKPAEGNLLFGARGTAQSVGGNPLTPISLRQAAVLNWRATLPDRGQYKSVQAHWHDKTIAQKMTATAGQGEPVKKLHGVYPTQDEAMAAAQSQYKALNRTGGGVSVTIIGDPTAAAGAPVTLAGFRDGINGDWIAKRVEHGVNDSGYTTRIECEKPDI